MELSARLAEIHALGAEVVAIAQEETDPGRLAHTRRFVGDGLVLLADPQHRTWKDLPRYGIFLVDRGRVARTWVPGSKLARPRLDLALEALRGSAPALPEIPAESPADTATAPSPDSVLQVRWLFSHDSIRPGGRVKLALVARIAPGWHVYGFGESAMTPFEMDLELPEGIERRDPIEYPRPHELHDPVLGSELAVYRDAVPISAITLYGGAELEPGNVVLRVHVRFQACNDNVCLPPTETTVELPLRVVPAGTRRRQIAGWQRW